MTDIWEDVREALVAKLAASSGMAAAGLRGASGDLEPVNPPPHWYVWPPEFTFTTGGADAEEYLLAYPWELVVPKPSGRTRPAPIAAAIVRAAQEELRTGVKLGKSYVVDVRLMSAAHGIEAMADTEQTGMRGTIVVQVYETHATRTV